MEDPYLRQILLYAIGSTVLVALVIWLAIHRHRAKWRRLRLRGHPAAKKREAERQARGRR